MSRIVITGTRHELTDESKRIIRHTLRKYSDSTIIHGNCSGVDKYVDLLAKRWGCDTISVNADWRMYGRGAGPIRNRQMIDNYNPDIVIGFPAKDSKGTYNCINYAIKQNVKTLIYPL